MLLMSILLLSLQAHASPTFEKGDFKAGLKGSLELQTRQTKNPSSAQESPIKDEWTDAQFSLALAQLNFKSQFKESRVEVNWFVRHGQSSLYQENRNAVKTINFPNRLVARDVFKLEYTRQDKDFQTDSVLNTFYYELDGEDSSFLIGRMLIKYGSGEFLNPINPFNQPLGMVNQQGIDQASDGMVARFYPSQKSEINFYLLGNKQQEDYENQLTRTLWIHGVYKFTDSLRANYVIGEDQRRNKGGGELLFEDKNLRLFLQALYSSNFINKKVSENLFDFVTGIKKQMSPFWALSFETGYQERDRRLVNANNLAFEDRLLPYEFFVAPGLEVSWSEKWKSQTNIIVDPKTEYVFGKTRLTWDLASFSALDFFASSPLSINKGKASLGQKLFTTDIGAALRLMF